MLSTILGVFIVCLKPPRDEKSLSVSCSFNTAYNLKYMQGLSSLCRFPNNQYPWLLWSNNNKKLPLSHLDARIILWGKYFYTSMRRGAAFGMTPPLVPWGSLQSLFPLGILNLHPISPIFSWISPTVPHRLSRTKKSLLPLQGVGKSSRVFTYR